MFDPINLLIQKNRLQNVSTGLGIFSSVLNGYQQQKESIFQANQLKLQAETALTIRATERLDQTYQQTLKADNLQRLLSSQSAYFASSGLTGATFQAIQNADISAYIRDASFASVGSQIKDTLVKQQNELYNIERKNIKDKGSSAFGMGLFGGVLNAISNVGS